MAFKFSIPFLAFRMHLHPGLSLLSPVADNAVLRTGHTLKSVAAQYADALQRKVLNTYQYHYLLDEYQDGDFYKDKLEVSFPAARDGGQLPRL
ncbi:MAG: hypothetical protein H6564_18255 [Lewinellaceae bacterium]|nr:hypothetical protein [Lewinellaceae bacterium]